MTTEGIVMLFYVGLLSIGEANGQSTRTGQYSYTEELAGKHVTLQPGCQTYMSLLGCAVSLNELCTRGMI